MRFFKPNSIESFPTPHFCVFCGNAFPENDFTIKRCPYCNISLPSRFRPRELNVDDSISYCMYCGKFVSEKGFEEGKCLKCGRELPEKE